MGGIKGYYTAGFTFVDNLSGGKLTEIKTKFSEDIGNQDESLRGLGEYENDGHIQDDRVENKRIK